MTVMVITRLTVILDISCQVCGDEFLNITAAATDDLYSLCFKDILRSLAHIAGKHDHHSHLSEHWSYSTLAATAFRRSHLADICDLSIDHIKYRIICAMTEVIIHTSIPCRYSYLHIFLSFNPDKGNKKAGVYPCRGSFSQKEMPILLRGLPISLQITVIWPLYEILAEKYVNSFARIFAT